MQPRVDRTRPARLWPVIAPETANPALAALAQQILDLADTGWATTPRVDLDGTGIRTFMADHRIATLVPPECVPTAQRAAWVTSQRQVAAAQLKLRAVAIEILELFHDVGLESRVLKGLATAELDYPRPALRHTGDVDLALRPGDIAAAVTLLKRHGYTDFVTPYSPLLAYGSTLFAPNGVEVDLHSRLFRRSPVGDQLFAQPGVALDRLPGLAFTASQRLVHAAGHVVIAPPGSRRMSGFVDITRIHQHPSVDLDEAQEFAASLGVEALVGAGLEIEALLTGRSQVLEHVAGWKRPDWIERRTRLVSERNLVLDHLSRFREVPPGKRLQYLPVWLLPDGRQRRLLWNRASRSARSLRGTFSRR